MEIRHNIRMYIFRGIMLRWKKLICTWHWALGKIWGFGHPDTPGVGYDYDLALYNQCSTTSSQWQLSLSLYVSHKQDSSLASESWPPLSFAILSIILGNERWHQILTIISSWAVSTVLMTDTWRKRKREKIF